MHPGERAGVGVPEIDREAGTAGDGGDDAGVELDHARGPDSAAVDGGALDRERGLGRRQAGVPADVHRRGSRVRRLAGEGQQLALDAGAAGDRGARQSLGLEHRALLDVQLQVAAEALQAPAGLERPLEGDAVVREHLADRPAVAVGQRREGVRIETAGEGRAAEQAAAESRALLVGAVEQGKGPRRPLPAPGPGPEDTESGGHPEAAVEPASGRHRVEMGAERQRRLPLALEIGPEISRLVALRRQADLAELLTEPVPGEPPVLPPADPARSRGTPGQGVELAQVGDHGAGVDLGARGHDRRLAAEPLAPQGLGEAVGAATSEREHLEVRIEHLEPARAELCVEVLRVPGRDHPIGAERDRVDAEAERVLDADLDDLEAGRREPADQPAARGLDAYGGELRGENRDEHVDVDEVAGDRLDPASQSKSSKIRASCRAPAWSVRSSPLPISTLPGSMMITSPPSRVPAVIIAWIGIPAPR